MKEKILSAYEEIAEKYDALIDHKPHNAYYDRPNTLALIPDFQDKVMLDAACGSGKYAEIFLEKGAKEVVGFDFSPKMVDLAKERNQGKGRFFVQDLAQRLDLPTAYFDVVVCALALHYLEDWTLTLQEFYRVLKPQGVLVVSMEHPFSDYLLFESKRYFEVEAVKCTWKGFGKPVEMNSFRRPLQECLSPFMENGFYIDQVLEPKPTAEFQRLDPRHFEELNAFPSFLCLRALKKPKI